MSDFSCFADRVKYALKKAQKTQADLAKFLGVKQPAISQWVRGVVEYPRGNLGVKAAKFLGVNEVWFIEGKGTPDAQSIILVEDDAPVPNNEYVQIKEYKIRVGAGPGQTPTYDEIVDSHPVTYKRSYFNSIGVDPNFCMRFEVYGDSMEPTLFEGDRILVNTADNKSINSGHVYAINVNDEVKVKRLSQRINGDLIIHSDNPLYQDEILEHDQQFTWFSVIGRVIEKSGGGGL